MGNKNIWWMLLCVSIIMTLVVIIMPVSFADCNNIDLNLITASPQINQTFKIEISGTSGPMDPWGNYENISIQVPAGLSNQSPLFYSVGAIVNPSLYSINIYPNIAGIVSITALLYDNVNANCSENLTFEIYPFDPNITINMENLANIVLGQQVSFNYYLNNTGPGNANNLTGSYKGSTNSTVNTFTDNFVNNKTSETNVGYYKPLQCGDDNITVSLSSYYSSDGRNMGTKTGVDSFTVVGPDASFSLVNITDLTPTFYDTITINATVTNPAGVTAYEADTVTVNYYYGSISAPNLIGTQNLNNISAGASKTASQSWVVNTCTDDEIIVVVSTANAECNSSNNQYTTATVNVSGKAAEVCNNNLDDDCDGSIDEGCSSGGGGSSGGSSSCSRTWVCEDWQDCQPNGMKTRVCNYTGSCSSEGSNGPIEDTSCIYIAPSTAIDSGNNQNSNQDLNQDSDGSQGESSGSSSDGSDGNSQGTGSQTGSTQTENKDLSIEGDKDASPITGMATKDSEGNIITRNPAAVVIILLILGVTAVYFIFLRKK